MGHEARLCNCPYSSHRCNPYSSTPESHSFLPSHPCSPRTKHRCACSCSKAQCVAASLYLGSIQAEDEEGWSKY